MKKAMCMSEHQQKISSNVHRITVDGKTIYLVGTAHVSRESVADVRETVEAVNPDAICVELCEARYKSIIQRDQWKKMDIYKVVKEKKALFLLAQMIMGSFYKRLGEQLEIKPGAEMLEGIELAKKRGAALILADRNIEITLRRVWGHLNFFNKIKMAGNLSFGLLFSEKIDESMVEELKQKDQLENVLEMFAKEFPKVKNYLIDERDRYLAQKIREASGKTIVAVVGAGHVSGIKKHIQQNQSLQPLLETPPKSLVPKITGWAIPLAIVALFVVGFLKGGTLDSLYIWFFVNGSLSALGSALALAHPLTIIVAFLAAPITSLNPFMAAGWVAGLVQALIKKPTVADMEQLPATTFKAFWVNPAIRILLVVAMANLGSMLGTFIAGGWIAGRVF